MNVNNFNIIINQQKRTFHVERSQSQQRGSFFSKISHIKKDYETTLQNLKNIETVVKNNWTYDSQKDKYSELKKDELYLKLSSKASKITDSYKKSLSWIERIIVRIFFGSKGIDETTSHIEESARLYHAKKLGFHGTKRSEVEDYLTQLRNSLREDPGGIAVRLTENKKDISQLSWSEIEKGFSSLSEKEIYDLLASNVYHEDKAKPVRNCLFHLIQSKTFSKRGADAEIVMAKQTALRNAVYAPNQKELVQFLLNNGANVNGQDAKGNSILQNAVSAGNVKITELLLNAGAKIDHKNHRGETALMLAKKLSPAQQKASLEIVKKLSQHQAREYYNNQIDQLLYNLENGLKVDEKVAQRIYSQFLEKAKTLNIPENDPSIQRLQHLLNSFYIVNLIGKVAQNQMTIPSSLAQLFKRLGLENVFKHITKDEKQALTAHLLDYLKEENRSWLEKPSHEFVVQVQRNFLEGLTSILTKATPRLVEFHPLIKRLYQFELDAQQTMQQAEHDTRVRESEILSKRKEPQSEEDRKDADFFLEKWQIQTFPSLLPQMLNEFFDQFDLAKLTNHNEQKKMEAAFVRLKERASLEEMKGAYNKKVVQPFIDYKLKLHEQIKWIDKNAKACCFEYNQAQWGDQQIFGEGVCAAINYRWIRHLMQNPIQKIKSAEQLEEKAQKESGVTAKDRITQAAYAVSAKLEPEADTYGMAPYILKKDGLKFALIEEKQPSIEELIDDLIENRPDTLNSGVTNGIFGITAQQKKIKAHALGMQIDNEHGIYRFWDVNTGFYEYRSLEKMKTEFSSYMKRFYPDYEQLYAGQYSPTK